MAIRIGGLDDLHAVFSLNREVFDSCWSYQSLYSALESGYDLIICEEHDELAGYLLSMTIIDEVQIMQVAVAPSQRRKGIAAAMSNYLFAASAEMYSMMLEVRLSNDAARALYQKLGFAEVGCRKNYYAADASGLREDAILMTKLIQS